MTEAQAEQFIDDIVAGKLSDDAIGAVLTEMANRGETVAEIVGVARGMRKHAVPLDLQQYSLIKNSSTLRAPQGDASAHSASAKAQSEGVPKLGTPERLPELKIMDTCGTGGSGLPRMNISTTASFVLAAGGIRIAKHGNRSASSRSGSFDMLEKLGINIDLSPEKTAEAITKVGIGFLFTRLFHPAMKAVAPIRTKLGIRTIFNFAGPLTNPAKPAYHMLGTTGKENAEKMIEAMKGLDYTRAMVVTGEDGLDDVTITGKTFVYELDRGKIRDYEFVPEDVGIPRVPFEAISGGSAEENASRCIELLQGKATGALQNLLIVNCGFGFTLGEITRSVNEGMELAYEILRSGDAYKKFTEYKDFSNQFAAAAAA